jgi:hypothetical protein
MAVIRTALWWGIGWMIAGAVIGGAMMLGRVEFMAESGARPLGIADHDIWVILLGIAGAGFGLLLGTFTEILLRLWALRHPEAPSLRGRTVAAAFAGGITGAIFLAPETTVLGALLGAVTPAAVRVIGHIRR